MQIKPEMSEKSDSCINPYEKIFSELLSSFQHTFVRYFLATFFYVTFAAFAYAKVRGQRSFCVPQNSLTFARYARSLSKRKEKRDKEWAKPHNKHQLILFIKQKLLRESCYLFYLSKNTTTPTNGGRAFFCNVLAAFFIYGMEGQFHLKGGLVRFAAPRRIIHLFSWKEEDIYYANIERS